MKRWPDAELIAERRLKVVRGEKSKPAYVRVFKPLPDQDDWRCPYEFEGFRGNREFGLVGIDSFQALVLTLKMIPTEVACSAEYQDGSLRNEHDEAHFDIAAALGLEPQHPVEN